MRALLLLLLVSGTALADVRTPLDDDKREIPVPGDEPAQVDRTPEIRRLLPRLRDCFNRSLKRDPALVFHGPIEFVVDKNGQIADVRFGDEARGELLTLQRCIRQVVKGFHFSDGGPATYRYPLNIDPT
jgi:hypothetical protein